MFLRRSLASVALMGLSLSLSAGVQPAPVIRLEAQRSRREVKRYNVSPTSWRHTYLNHGPTAAQIQRAAKKARNVRRHKQHVRGRVCMPR